MTELLTNELEMVQGGYTPTPYEMVNGYYHPITGHWVDGDPRYMDTGTMPNP